MLHPFAKRLGVGIDILEQFVPRRAPARQPALQRVDPAEAKSAQDLGRGRDQPFAIVVEHHRHIAARQPPGDLHCQPAQRDLRGKQRVAGGKRGLFAQIDQRDFGARQQVVADIVRCHGWPQILGSTALA